MKRVHPSNCIKSPEFEIFSVVGLKVINMKGTITFMFLTIFIFFITFSNIEGRGRNFCKFQSTTQCPLGSKYIEIVIPTNNTCPDANFIYFPGGFGHFLFGRKDFDEPGKIAKKMVNTQVHYHY